MVISYDNIVVFLVEDKYKKNKIKKIKCKVVYIVETNTETRNKELN